MRGEEDGSDGIWDIKSYTARVRSLPNLRYCLADQSAFWDSEEAIVGVVAWKKRDCEERDLYEGGSGELVIGNDRVDVFEEDIWIADREAVGNDDSFM